MGAFSAQMSTVLLRSSKQGIQTRTQEMRAKSVNGGAVLCKGHTKYLHALAVTVTVSAPSAEREIALVISLEYCIILFGNYSTG